MLYGQKNDDMKIARVFPRRTAATPCDELVFFGPPPLLTLPEIDEVHVSVTFTYDRPKYEDETEELNYCPICGRPLTEEALAELGKRRGRSLKCLTGGKETSMDKTCSTCQHRNEHGVCTNAESVFFGSRVDDGACPAWENYDEEMWGAAPMSGCAGPRKATDLICKAICGIDRTNSTNGMENNMGIDVSRLGPAAQKQALAKLLGQKAAKKAKYHNEKAVRTMPNGLPRTFDSQREARRYDELRMMYEAGAIQDLRLQRSFTLQEGYVAADGEVIRPIVYKADFTYVQSGNLVVEDAKGAKTPEYQMKKKLMQGRYCITVREV